MAVTEHSTGRSATKRRRALSLAALVCAGLLSGCQDLNLLSLRYGFPVDYSDPTTAPHTGDGCAPELFGSGNVDSQGRVLQCQPDGSAFTWRTVAERGDTNSTVLVYGDSIAEETQGALTAALGPSWNAVYRVYGGTAPCDWTTWAARDIRAFRPSIVVTSFVGNNLTTCMQHDGIGLIGPADAEQYRLHLTLLAEAAVAGGAKVIITTSPVPSNRLFIDRSALVASASWTAARVLAEQGKPVYLSDDGAVLLDPVTTTQRLGAQWLPCRADGRESDACLGGMVQVHTPMPDGVHLCPSLSPRPNVGGCAVRNIGAERYGAALAATIAAVWADTPLPHPAPPVGVRGESADYRSGVPARLLDTRPSGATVDGVGQRLGVRPAGSITVVQVIGRGGVPAGTTAVALNLTATPPTTGPRSAGFLTAYACGERPGTSTLNFAAGATVANAAIIPLAADGTVCLFNSAAADVLLDVTGWFAPSGGYLALGPVRLLDTRAAGTTVDGTAAGLGVRLAGTVTEVAVAGRGGVPTDAGAVALNLTATGASSAGYITVFPCGTTVPTTSTLNIARGATVAGGAVTRLSARGSVCVFTSANTHVLIDVAGAFAPTSSLRAEVPARLADTRTTGATVDGRYAHIGRRNSGTTMELAVVGRAGVPADAAAVIVTVTATGATGNGFVTIYRCDTGRPATSTLNVAAGATTANSTIVALGGSGTICVFSAATTHVIVDVSGWFVATS
ncbi:MAG: hypothetical protein ABMA25_04855 [Ilumatobacteraceae bacterium]